MFYFTPDNKYVEEDEVKEPKKKSSTTSKPLEKHASNSSKKKRVDIQLREKKYDPELRKAPGSRNALDRRVEFSDQIRYQDRHGLDNGFIGDKRDNISGDQSTFTNSRDIRETEINFLNNDLTRDYDPRLESGPRLTHVDIKVAGGSRINSVGAPESGSNKKSRFLDIVSESPDMDGQPSDCSDSESAKGRRFKGNILNIGAGWC